MVFRRFGPNFLKVHLVTLGKTLAMGSTLSSGSSCIMLATWSKQKSLSWNRRYQASNLIFRVNFGPPCRKLYILNWPGCHRYGTPLQGKHPWGRCCQRRWGSRWTRWWASWRPRYCGCSGFPRDSGQAPFTLILESCYWNLVIGILLLEFCYWDFVIRILLLESWRWQG